MRLRVTLRVDEPTAVEFDHQHYLMALIYNLLDHSDADYAQFLHDKGYTHRDEPGRAFKMFHFSGLRTRTRRNQGGSILFLPGSAEWFIGSPVPMFLQNLAAALTQAARIRVGESRFHVAAVQTIAAPEFVAGKAQFSCMSPIVAAVRRPEEEGGGTYYLRPKTDRSAFELAIRNNLVRKHRVLYGMGPHDDTLRLLFDEQYLARDAHGGARKVCVNGIDVVGAFCPLQIECAPPLLRLLWDCGVGEKNSSGFGMVEAVGNTESIPAGKGV